jgi:hypothetical protein
MEEFGIKLKKKKKKKKKKKRVNGIKLLILAFQHPLKLLIIGSGFIKVEEALRLG